MSAQPQDVAEIDLADQVSDVPNAQLYAALLPVVSRLDRQTLVRLTASYAADRIRDERRTRTLRAERAAEIPAVRDDTPGSRAQRHGTWNARGPARKGCTCELCTRAVAAYAEAEQEAAESRQALVQKLAEIADEYADRRRIEWTSELLDSGFALPDGTVVLWGDATIAQHSERAAMLTRNAAANAEAAARHRKAIGDLTERGAETLRELVVQR